MYSRRDFPATTTLQRAAEQPRKRIASVFTWCGPMAMSCRVPAPAGSGARRAWKYAQGIRSSYRSIRNGAPCCRCGKPSPRSSTTLPSGPYWRVTYRMTNDEDTDRRRNSMTHAGGQPDRDEGLNLFEMGALMRANRRILIITTAVMVGLSLVYVFVARDWYRAEVLMKVADQRQNQGLLGGLSGGALGGLASLAGIDFGGETKSAEPLAVLKSRKFAEAFIKDLDLLPVFFYR